MKETNINQYLYKALYKKINFCEKKFYFTKKNQLFQERMNIKLKSGIIKLIFLSFILISMNTLFASSISVRNKKSQTQVIKCDYLFESMIEINEKEFEKYDDHRLKLLYHKRNSSLRACLYFYNTLFFILDEMFNSFK
jgi:hypothetical protein